MTERGRRPPIGYALKTDGDHLRGEARVASWPGPTGRPR